VSRDWFHILPRKMAAIMTGRAIRGYWNVALHRLPTADSIQPSSLKQW
jgi:hypothetical protein